MTCHVTVLSTLSVILTVSLALCGIYICYLKQQLEIKIQQLVAPFRFLHFVFFSLILFWLVCKQVLPVRETHFAFEDGGDRVQIYISIVMK